MRLPNLAALQMLEASARLASFTRAAAELSVTESAVCRQILSMEERYGVRLFERVKKKLILTSEGENYVNSIRDQIRDIELATNELAARAGGRQVIDLAVLPTFATQWLVPRLASFAAKNPRTLVNVHSRIDPFLLRDSRFDAAVYSGRSPWPAVLGKKILVEGPSIPVCGVGMASRLNVRSRKDLLNYPLLHVIARPNAWENWIGKDDRDLRLAASLGSRFELFTMVVRAAAAGLGIALLPKLFIQDELKRGILIPVLKCEQSTAESDEESLTYFISYRSDPMPQKVLQFMEWLDSESKST